MKKTLIAISCLGLLVIAMPAPGAILGNAVDGAAWLQEDLTGSEPEFVTADNEVTVAFNARGSGIPEPIAAGIGADVSVMAGVVVGDYSDVEGLSFRVTRTGAARVDVSVRIKGANGVEWAYQATPLLSDASGEESIINVPLDPDQWWHLGKSASYNARWLAGWEDTLNDVTMVRVVLTHVSFDADTATIGDFRVVGEGFISDPAALQVVNAHFGKQIANVDQLTEEERNHDSDRDGRTDVAQILDGEDPGLSVEIIDVDTQGRARLRWDAANGRSYRVERAKSLTGPPDFDTVLDNVPSEGFGQMERTDAAPIESGQPYFYRVIKK